MANLTRLEVCERLARHYSEKFSGKVWAGFDCTKRQYYIRGEGLPAAPELQSQYPNGWSLLDFIPPRKARELITA